jgi:hypothetical protein
VPFGVSLNTDAGTFIISIVFEHNCCLVSLVLVLVLVQTQSKNIGTCVLGEYAGSHRSNHLCAKPSRG